tara:strand:- start:21229 stop:21636 length:408 start_codon:yes stop_codon:yes gene_type:complete
MNKQQGFTLIELLISLFILGILAAIAYPSYQGFVIKTRRVDAQSELIKAQIEQSSYRITHPTYINNTTSAGLPSNNQHYTFSVVSASVNTYIMKAEAKSTSSQSNDQVICKTLFIDQNNTKTSDGNTENNSCWVN